MTFPDQRIAASPLGLGEGFVCWALSLLGESADCLREEGAVTPDMAENHITQRLDAKMKELGTNRPTDIGTWSMRPLRTNPGDPDNTFEPDLVFQARAFSYDPNVYLGVEAKKLFGSGTTLAWAYVNKGAMKFIQGPYSLGMDYGIMLGYVVAPPVKHAVASVETAMLTYCGSSWQIPTHGPVSPLAGNWPVYATCHQQQHADNEIRLLHMFVLVV